MVFLSIHELSDPLGVTRHQITFTLRQARSHMIIMRKLDIICMIGQKERPVEVQRAQDDSPADTHN